MIEKKDKKDLSLFFIKGIIWHRIKILISWGSGQCQFRNIIYPDFSGRFSPWHELISQKPQCSQKWTSLTTECRLIKILRNFVKRALCNKKPKIKYWNYFLAACNKKWGQNTMNKKKVLFKRTDGKWDEGRPGPL